MKTSAKREREGDQRVLQGNKEGREEGQKRRKGEEKRGRREEMKGRRGQERLDDNLPDSPWEAAVGWQLSRPTHTHTTAAPQDSSLEVKDKEKR